MPERLPTGISAYDRAATIAALAKPDSQFDDFYHQAIFSP
jgi:3,4-dihydroxy-2-butanone 4-phosphate synthase